MITVAFRLTICESSCLYDKGWRTIFAILAISILIQFAADRMELVTSYPVQPQATDQVDMDACVKFGDSRSNYSWDIGVAHFVMDERPTTTDGGHDVNTLLVYKYSYFLKYCESWTFRT